MALTTNLNQHFNLRSTGNLFGYSTSFTTNGIPASAKLNLKSAGTAVDIYPFHKGFRVSPGLLFYNANQVTADASIPGGTSFTLNNQTYYSANANPATGAKPVDGTGQISLSSGTVTLTASQIAIKKNTALNNFSFLMLSSSDHVTPATGLTVTAQRSIDGAAFGACANSVTELSNGFYLINLAAADLNGTVISLKFTATSADARNVTVVTQA